MKLNDIPGVSSANGLNVVLTGANGDKKMDAEALQMEFYNNGPAPWRDGKEIPFTPAEIHEKTVAGDFSGLRVKGYKTMTLTTGEV